MKSLVKFLALTLCGFAYLHAPAHAQFVGDVFFVLPSVSTTVGSTVQMDLAIFSGTQTFGVTRAQIQFDTSELEVASVESVTTGMVTPAINWYVDDGLLKILVVNGQSLKNPIGTVVLARIGFRAIAGAGTIALLTTQVSNAYGADKTALPVGTGFGGEVIITSAASAKAKMDGNVAPLHVAANSGLGERALKLRPAGHQVSLAVLDPMGRAKQTVVKTTPSAGTVTD